METLLEIPALFKILSLFAFIVLLYRLKVPLWADLLAASALCGLWFGASPGETARMAFSSALHSETLFLCAVVVLILGFSNMMAGVGVLERIVTAFSALLGNSMYSGAALPALIGLLPMPGGAIFSAPMVETACGSDGGQTPEQKAAINYWFRHIWEYWWPLYPGVILASHLFGVSMWVMVAIHLPLTLFAVASGYFFILRPAFRNTISCNTARESGGGSLKRAVSESACIIVVIATIFIAGPVLSRTGMSGDIAAKYWPVIFGFIFGSAWLAVSTRVSMRRFVKYMFARNQLSMLMLAVGIMVFRDMLTGMNAFTGAQADLETYNIPAVAVIALLPFLAGIVMGIAIGFVGSSFPLVISLLPAGALDSQSRLAYLTLAYSFGYMGMMLSPVHFCFIMTKDYFKADFAGIYRWLIGPAGLMMAAGVAFFLFYHAVFPS